MNVWGVGTRLVTSFSCPALGGVYKLTALDENGRRMTPKIKRSDNPEKITNPGLKSVVRMFDPKGQMRGDILFLADEPLPRKRAFRAYHPTFAYLTKNYPRRFTLKELLVPVFRKGKLVYENPDLHTVRRHTLANLEALDATYRRFANPHAYHVSLSSRLFRTKQRLLQQAAKNGARG